MFPFVQALLFSQPNLKGMLWLALLDGPERYTQIQNGVLSALGMLDSVASGSLYTDGAEDANLVIFSNSDYTGPFTEIALSRSDESEGYWHTGGAQSALLIGSNNVGVTENRVSFVQQFRTEWDSYLDGQLQGSQVSRDAEPLLTWQMFPTSDPYLTSSQTYLRIHQPLTVDVGWPWGDYSASMDYNVVLYIDGNSHLRAWVADWEYWVSGGAKTGDVVNSLAPKIKAGMSPLQDQLNQKLALTDLLGPIKAVYYLPAWQPTPVGSKVFFGNTADDVTIVVQT